MSQRSGLFQIESDHYMYLLIIGQQKLTFARGWKTQETRIRMHLLHATSLSFEMHFIYECQSIGDGKGS